MRGELMQVGDDLRAAASFVAATLAPVADNEGWERVATPTNWSCRDTLDHVANALAGYATSLATGLGAERRRFPRNGDPDASPADLLEVVPAFAHVLAAVAENSPRSRRAFHPAGMADRDGFVAMGCDEMLIHGDDIARALGVDYAPPPELTGRVVARLFPWAPTDRDPWAVLRWANGRAALADEPPLDADWWWHCAPLADWGGQPHRRGADNQPGWR